MVSSTRAWLFFGAWLLSVAIVAIAAAGSDGSRYSVRLTHRVDVQVRHAHACRPWLGLKPWPVQRRYARKSSAWRRGALRHWRRRAHRCLEAKQRVGVPPWFRAKMMCVHPHESSNWFLDGHHDGGLQFAQSTWEAAGGLRFARHAYEATPNEQIRAAWNLTHGSPKLLRVHWGQTIGYCE